MSSDQTGQTETQKIVVVGGGRAGEAILDLLSTDERFDTFVCETSYDRLRTLRVAGHKGDQISGTDSHAMDTVLKGAVCVICAAPPTVSVPVARAAALAGCHYVGMSEDAADIGKIDEIAHSADGCFAPACGLSPGLVPALVDQMIGQLDASANVTTYVGVLPATPTNRLGYGNLWGIDGLMAEYTNDCLALRNGKVVTAPPLQSLEDIQVDGEAFEAFTTSGSQEDLVKHYSGKIRGLEFKTIRYPGHLDYIQFLLDDLKLSKRLYAFRNLLLNGLPSIERDRVVIHVVNNDASDPRTITCHFSATDLGDGRWRSAVSSVAALHVAAVTDTLIAGRAPAKGVLHHSDLALELLGQSRYGQALQMQV